MENLIPMMGAVLALMGSPGPVTLASAAFGAVYGVRAFPFVLIMTLGTLTVIVLVALGIIGLLTAFPGAAEAIAVLAGLYILYLAYRIATAPPAARLEEAPQRPPLTGVYLMAVGNPKAWAAMGALFSGYPLMHDPVAGGVLKAVLLTGCALAINTIWMLGGTALAEVMRGPRSGRVLNVAFGVLMAVSVGAMLLV